MRGLGDPFVLIRVYENTVRKEKYSQVVYGSNYSSIVDESNCHLFKNSITSHS